MTDRRGFSLIEVLIVVVLIGLMTAFALPRISSGLVKQNVHSARVAYTTMYAKARSYAIQRARQVAMLTRNNQILLVSANPVTSTKIDTIGAVVDLYNRYGVTVSTTNDSLVIDQRGIGAAAATTTVAVTKSVYADTVQISAVGNIIR